MVLRDRAEDLGQLFHGLPGTAEKLRSVPAPGDQIEVLGFVAEYVTLRVFHVLETFAAYRPMLRLAVSDDQLARLFGDEYDWLGFVCPLRRQRRLRIDPVAVVGQVI